MSRTLNAARRALERVENPCPELATVCPLPAIARQRWLPPLSAYTSKFQVAHLDTKFSAAVRALPADEKLSP